MSISVFEFGALQFHCPTHPSEVKLALEECRHWLEGSVLPFTVWTDHKNVAYIQTAKRLNSRQASCMVVAVSWEIESRVRQAQLNQPDSVRSDVLQWSHSTHLTCHPGMNRRVAFLRQRFWWPTMERDTREFISACSVCARNKTSTKPTSGLLHPLPIPSHPWSHIALDFVTGLPPSNGNSVILTIIDRFSKVAHFIPISKLPSSRETADLLVSHVLRLHGIPSGIVSDRGPQFSSQVWRDFCTALGIKVSLLSGYHPQTNGQTERASQELETAIRCVTSANPSSWSAQLSWVEYAHNTPIHQRLIRYVSF
uniref:Gypsy retrotransposon integrase-like protein 1 n=1 Tax=Salmo trutta TaxID=8032 RepID=A0A674BG65_SALTR